MKTLEEAIGEMNGPVTKDVNDYERQHRNLECTRHKLYDTMNRLRKESVAVIKKYIRRELRGFSVSFHSDPWYFDYSSGRNGDLFVTKANLRFSVFLHTKGDKHNLKVEVHCSPQCRKDIDLACADVKFVSRQWKKGK